MTSAPAFYTSCFSHIADKYGISAIQAIKAKNRELWPGEIMMSGYSLTDDLVEKVYNKLPKQPWPVKVHKQVADELGLNEMVVSNAIGYLIFKGRLLDQVYGYVFDKDENIVIEGKHFGRTEKEARIKFAEQKAMREKKFGVDSF